MHLALCLRSAAAPSHALAALVQVQIPVSGINIGPVHKKDVMRANIMAEKKLQKYACILAFDVPITRDARTLAASLGVTIFAADIIYHLFDMFTEYTKKCKADEKEGAELEAVFPARLRIVPGCVFNARDPIVLGCEVLDGQLRVGTPLTIPAKECDLGRVQGMEKDHKAIEKAEKCASRCARVCLRLRETVRDAVACALTRGGDGPRADADGCAVSMPYSMLWWNWCMRPWPGHQSSGRARAGATRWRSRSSRQTRRRRAASLAATLTSRTRSSRS
jgi:Translation-initiation factor 2